jgi:hypothetical protein
LFGILVFGDVFGGLRVRPLSLLNLLVVTPGQLIAVRFYHSFATAIFGTVASRPP